MLGCHTKESENEQKGSHVQLLKYIEYQQVYEELRMKTSYGCAVVEICVQEVPKTNSSNRREIDWTGGLGGITRRVGEFGLARQSWGTQ